MMLLNNVSTEAISTQATTAAWKKHKVVQRQGYAAFPTPPQSSHKEFQAAFSLHPTDQPCKPRDLDQIQFVMNG